MWRADGASAAFGAPGERRLPALLAVSLAVHAVALAWVKMPAERTQAALPAVSMLFASLRLASSPSAVSAPAPQAIPAAARAPREARRLPSRQDSRAQSAVPASAGPTTAAATLASEAAVPVASLASASSPAASTVSASAAAPAVAAAAGAERPAPAASGADAARQLDDYGQRLAELFSRQQQYPRLAALRGWEGEVRVRLSVARQGGLSAVRLERSSGYEVLDRHALAMIEEIGRLPPPPAEFVQPGGDVQVVVPVHYRLKKST